MEVLKELLKHKANIEIAPVGEKLLILAVSERHSSVVKALLNAGADFSEQLEGWTPLHFACEFDENLDIIEILLSAGADPDTLGPGKFRPLHLAADWSQPGAAQKLLEAGANEDPVGGDSRWTPLLLAAYHSSLEIVRILLEYGVDIERRLRAEYEGCTALHLGSNNSEIVRLLLAHGADISTRDVSERTPLFYAAGGGNVESTNELLKCGLKKNLEDKFGRVALDVTLNRSVWNAFFLEGETEPYPEDITCGMISTSAGNNFRFSKYGCDICDRKMENEFFYHCCECEHGEVSYFDICITCYNRGKRCPGNHKLRARFWGDGMVSFEEFRPWVATLKTPAQLRESSAIGADGMSVTASEQLEKE